ncbi:MAG: DUF1993 domain-containing protein [Myxococcota bacterium]
MSTSLYALCVPSYLQTLGAVAGFLEKGRLHCQSAGIDLQSLVEFRLAPDMLPFRFQIVSVLHHSLGTIQALETGRFGPPTDGGLDYAGLQKQVAEAQEKLKGLSAAAIDRHAGRDVLFQLGDMKLPFVAEDFVLSFSFPNFYFHAATAYDILRLKGVPLGKGDFLGAMRMKR